MRKLWYDERFVNDNTLSVNINRLRIKLEGIGLIDIIITKKGLGYMVITSKRCKMFTLFLRERYPWILFFIVLLVSMNLLFYLYTGFSGVSIVYFNIVTFSMVSFFLVVRYTIETRQVKHYLGNISELNKLSSESITFTPYQQKYAEVIHSIIETKELQLNNSKIQLQEETENLLAWVHEMKTPLTAMKLMMNKSRILS